MGVSRRKVKKVGPEKEKVTKLSVPKPDVLIGAHVRNPAFKLSERQAESAQVAVRFGLEREELKQAVAAVNASKQPEVTVKVSLTKRRAEMQDALEDLYDKSAHKWGFANMAEMMVTAHTELVARAISHPESFGKEGLSALKEVQKLLYPIEKATKTETRRVPAGDNREIVLRRIEDRLKEKKIEAKEASNEV